MDATDLIALLPMIIIGATSVIVMLVITFQRGRGGAFLLALAGQALSLATIPMASGYAPRQVTVLLTVDSYSLILSGLFVVAGLAVLILSYSYLQRRSGELEEFSLMLLLATLGALVLVSSAHFASFLMGLEILSVSLYVLIAYTSAERRSLEAGLKYLILAGASSAILLFGMALLYAELGTMEFARIANSPNLAGPLTLPGFALVLSGIGFKLALVPFHMWTPDIYEGAPAPVTAFIATVSKGAVFALLLRYFTGADGYGHRQLLTALGMVSVASMVIGNLLALMQTNVKRLLAYSSIAHLGYLMVALLSGRDLAARVSTFYLVTYFISIMGAFGVVALLSDGERDTDELSEYRGLFWRRPWTAAVFTASLFSLAGIPLTAGFVGKFYLLTAGVGSALWAPVLVLVATSAIGLFYYLRVIVALYSSAPTTNDRGVQLFGHGLSWSGSLVLAGLLILLLWLGVYPGPFLRLIQQAVL